MNQDMLTIKDVVNILRKRILLISIIVILSTVAAGLLSYFVIKPQYQSSTKIFIGKEGDDTTNTVINYQNNDVQMYQNLMKTFSELLQTDDLISRALSNSNIEGNPKEILGHLSVVPQDKSQILDMSIKFNDPYDATKILKAINDEFIISSKKLIGNSKVVVIKDPQVQETPISPNKKMNILIAFAMSLMLGVTLSLFLEYLDNTVKTKDDITKLLGVPVLGSIKEMSEKDISKHKKSKRRANKCSKSKKTQEVYTQNPLEL